MISSEKRVKNVQKTVGEENLPISQSAFYNIDLNLVAESGKIGVMPDSTVGGVRLWNKFEITGDKKVMIKERVLVCPVR